MPIAHIYLLEGRTDEQKSRAIAVTTEALCDALDVPAESVRIILHDTPAGHWGVGGIAMSTRARPN